MIFGFVVLYFLVVDVASELFLKIDLNESTDERTTANFLYIKFVNKTDSEHMLNDDNDLSIDDNKENLNRMHQLVKRNPDNDPMSVSLNDNTFDHNLPLHPHMNIPLVQWRGDNSRIKELLDDFKMNKRRTYVSTPIYNYPLKKYNEFVTGENNIFRRKDKPTVNSQMAREIEIFDIISNQNKLIERVANKFFDAEKRKKKIVRTIFDDILNSVEERQNKTTAAVASNVTTTTTTETSKLSTVLTIVDETEIREALKKNPFVSRILRMAAKKRQEYEAKKQTEGDFLA